MAEDAGVQDVPEMADEANAVPAKAPPNSSVLPKTSRVLRKTCPRHRKSGGGLTTDSPGRKAVTRLCSARIYVSPIHG
ncbi:hypothetical protein GCM10009827_076840 [Dactylosporangium maewongense]|uniref:Uncharacterized protein n=1 Tax=Dactylosporangium maewongense TaxID=634393 RepID=A0ABN2BT13_9ACTN